MCAFGVEFEIRQPVARHHHNLVWDDVATSCTQYCYRTNDMFIIEVHEPELAQQVSLALRVSEESHPDVRVSETVVPLDREQEDDSYMQLCAAVSEGVSVIVDLSWSPWELLETLVASTGLPIVHTALGSQQLIRALDDYLETRNATDAALIMETESDVDRTLYELLGASNIRVWVHAGLTRDSARALKTMRPEPSFYAVVGEGGFVMDTYRRAVKEKLVRRDYRWNLLFTDYSSSTVDQTAIEQAAMVLHVDPAECCRLTGQREDCCSADMQKKQYTLNSLIQYIMETYSKLEVELPHVSARVECDVFGSTMNATSERLYRQFADDTDLSNDTTFYWDGERSGLYLRSRFVLSTIKPDEGLQTVASWSADEEYKLLPGVELEPIKLFFRVGTAPGVPWTMHKMDPNTGDLMYNEDGQPIYEGYCIDLIAKLAEAMNFDYEIVTPKSGGFGKKLPNGTWNGVVGDLVKGETDLAVAALTMTAEREEVIDFVAPYFDQTGILIVIRKPIRKTSLFKFMTVLRTEVWLSIVAALVLTGFMIWLLDKYSPYSARNNPEAYPYPCREFTLKESFWFALTSFTPQGGGEAPKALSGRTLVAAYWLFVVLMLATFTANLAAFLTVERMQTPVSSLEQLARQSRINYTVVEGSSIHQYFINMKFAEDTLYRVWKEITLNATSDQAQYRVWDYPIREQYGHILLAINASGPVPDAKTGFQQVNDHADADFAFIHDSAEIRYEVTRNCNLTEVGDMFAEQPYAIAVQQGSRLQENLSRALLELQKERFLEMLANKYWNETARQACPDADESEGITLESLGGVFIATLFGLGLAMITLAWEVFYYKRKEKNKVQTIDIVPEKQAFEEPKKKENIFNNVARLRKKNKNKGKGDKAGNTNSVTIGDSFKPVGDKISYISVFPKGDYRP
ncbi:glutamate receptor ionotropic, kainate 2 [Pectinophora gossypiella]|uniref:glutamate receptor ionotropic, kainate 2 n=1 Tax=Pectinophora gossypiella TaxID=13191 RepID=UPI00214F565C|nr:glutamate receptor ionotropic, kainate 2 [Pectinophora gossypiella]